MKKAVSLILAFIMLFSVFTTPVIAAETSAAETSESVFDFSWFTDMIEKIMSFFRKIASLFGIKTEETEDVTNYTPEQMNTGLPAIYVNTASGNPVAAKEWESADISIVGCDNENYNLDITDIQIKGRGHSSWMGAGEKNSYTIKFDKKQNLFGIGKDKKWALIANYYDKTLIRNWLAHTLDSEVFDYGDFDITQIPVDLFVNGEYVGNYYLSSVIKIGSSRIDIPDISDEITEDVNGDGVINYFDAGFVLEVDHRRGEKYYYTGTCSYAPFCLVDPDLEDENEYNEAIFEHVKGIIQTAEDALYSDNFADPETGYAKYIDADSFIDYILIEEIAKNMDSNFVFSNHMYYDPSDGLIHAAPVWDFDIAFGNINYSDGVDWQNIGITGKWFGRLQEDPAFMKKLVARWNEKKSQLTEIVNSGIQKQADKLSVSAKYNFKKWDILGTYTWPAPDGYLLRRTYQSEVDFLINWTSKRITWLDNYYNSLDI